MRRTVLLTALLALIIAPAAMAKMNTIKGAKCTTCHTAMGKKDLNAVGDFAKTTIKNGEPDYKAVAAHLAKK